MNGLHNKESVISNGENTNLIHLIAESALEANTANTVEKNRLPAQKNCL